jgi:AraC-like DNA-binding protein
MTAIDQEKGGGVALGEAEPEYEFDVTSGHDHTAMTVRWGGNEILAEKPIETPSLPYPMLKFCYRGQGVLDWDEGRCEISAGMVFWAAAKTATTLKASPDVEMANYALFLAGKETTKLFDTFLHVPIGATKLKEPHFVMKIFRDLMDEGRSTSQHREENCVLLTRVLLRRIEAQSLTRLPANALARQTFKRCREHIARNFMQLTTLREVAEGCDVTVPYLCRLFDQFFDCSPYDYMTRLKMSRAENLLLRPNSPIHEVAGAVGYKDARLFARNFKAMYGKSPTQYRQVHAVAAEQ